jgi:predicted nucleic-acid-binding Zn-ribbon protein
MGRNKEVKIHRKQNGEKMKCLMCEHDQFWVRKTLMNTVGFSFFNLDWANKSATNYVCDKCGYVHWFLEK